MDTTIYYFTSTGNSLKIAKDLKDDLENTSIVQICKNNMNIKSETKSERIGFVFPVYFRGLPHMVKKFVENLNINANSYCFAAASYGSNAALSFEQLNHLLTSKGAVLSRAFGIPMPGTMWSMYYPHPKEDYINRIEAQRELTREIAKEINNKTIVKLPEINNRTLEEKMYSAFQPSGEDKDFWADEKCDGCGICARICAANNIIMSNQKPQWQHQCEQCLACLHWCPKESIQYKKDSLNKERYHNPYVKVEELFQKH
ncbi:EFR1 family ferrodoxin [Clostridium thailandense]|uniref:EFR1 family ferrodoxin n=1 Tax=Clostridium thailandense TaxID=2794346 RepID=UPI00398980DD